MKHLESAGLVTVGANVEVFAQELLASKAVVVDVGQFDTAAYANIIFVPVRID